MKLYFHAFVTFEDKLLVMRSKSSEEKFVPGASFLSADPYDEWLIKQIQKQTGLTAFIGKPFFLRDSVVRGERTLEIFVKATAGSDLVNLGEGLQDAEWIEASDFLNHNIAEHLHAAFEAYEE